MSYSRKRSRGCSSDTPASRAYWASKKFSDIAPWSTAGAARMARGHPFTRSMMGDTYATANATQRANRIGSGYTGRGLYSGRGSYLSDIGGEIGSIFGKKGRAIGGKIASGIGAALPFAGLAAKAYAGKGLYTTNSLVRGVGDHRPSMSVTGGGDNQTMVITHKEYVQDVYGPENSEFTNNGLSINPGLAMNMPWLAQVAANYEEYEFEQLVFEFHSTVDASAASNSNGATGTFIMATNYNPDAPNFYSKEVMMQYHGASSGRVTDDQVHGVECDTSKNAGSAIRFVRTGTPPNDQSLKDFDLGKFQWAVTNIPTGFENQQIGELWVHYRIKLSKPRLYSGVYRALPYQSFAAASPADSSALWINNQVGAPMLIFGQTNNSQYIVPSIGTSELKAELNWDTLGGTANVLRAKFPSSMTGSFDILVKLRSNSTNGWLGPRNLEEPTTGGNVVLSADLADAGDSTVSGTVPPFTLVTQNQPLLVNNFQVNCPGRATGGTISTATYMGQFHVLVAPATAGVDNTFSIEVDIGACIIDCCTVEIKPYNNLGTTLTDAKPQYNEYN